MKRTTGRIGRSIGLTLVVIALAMFAGVCGSSSKPAASKGSTVSTGDATITIHNFMFGPAVLHATAGTTVTVKNADDTDHTVTADDGSFDTGPIHSGKSATFVVAKAGTIKFHCNIHNYMNGTIQVTG